MTQLHSRSCKVPCWKELAKILKKAIYYFRAKVDYSSTDADIYRMHFIIGTDLEINGSFSVSTPLCMCSSPKHWPFPLLSPDLLVLHYLTHKSHTDRHWMLGKGIDRDIWLLLDNMHNWGEGKQVISLSEVSVSQNYRPWCAAPTAVEMDLWLNT